MLNRALPCPFCTKSNLGIYTASSVWALQVECVACGARGPRSFTDDADAIAEWNDRLSPGGGGSLGPGPPALIGGVNKTPKQLAREMLARVTQNTNADMRPQVALHLARDLLNMVVESDDKKTQ